MNERAYQSFLSEVEKIANAALGANVMKAIPVSGAFKKITFAPKSVGTQIKPPRMKPAPNFSANTKLTTLPSTNRSI